MTRIKVRNQIKIDRNIVEKTLMTIKDFIRDNRKIVLFSLAGVILVIIIFLVSFVVYENAAEDNRIELEKIVNDYQTYIDENNTEKIPTIIDRLKKYIEDTSVGFSHDMAYYTLGNIYYSQAKYKEAREYLLLFVENSSSTMFNTIALLKAAYAAEEEGTLDGSMKIYKKLENDYVNSIVEDQVFYNMGRIYAMKGDVYNSRKYFNRVITSFPQSLLAKKSRERLFLLSKSGR